MPAINGPTVWGEISFVAEDIKRKCQLLSLDRHVTEQSIDTFKRANSSGATKYKNPEDVIVALIYISCRQNGIPITLHKICDSLKIGYKPVNRTFRQLTKNMQIRIPTISTVHYIEELGANMDVPEDTIRIAKRLIEKMRRNGDISGKGRAGLAAAALCLASESNCKIVNQKNIASIAGVTQVTIRNRYRELECLLCPPKV